MAKKKPEEPKNPWTARIKRMREYQKKHSATWKRNEKLLFGQTEGDGMSADHMSISYGWGLLKNLETEIYVQNPDVVAEARNPMLDAVAQRVTQIAKYDVEDMDVKTLGNLGLMDCFCYGYFACIETMEVEKKAGRYLNDDTGEYEDGVTVAQQEYVARRVAPRDILFDPAGRLLDLSDHRYIAIAFYPTIAALKADGRFKLPPDEDIAEWPEVHEGSRENPSVVAREYGASGGYSGPEKDPDYKTICVWEIHDKVAHKIVYMTDFQSKLLAEEEWPAKLKIKARDLFPVTMMAFHQRSDRFYPIPEMDLIAPQLKEINKIDSMMRQDSVTKWRKWVTVGGLIPQDKLAMITDTSIENAIIEIDRTEIEALVGMNNAYHIDLRNLVVPLEDIALKRDLPVRYQMVEQQIQHILGYGATSGMLGNVRTRSAREAMMVADARKQKLQKRLDGVAEFYRLWHTKHMKFLQQTMDLERAARLIPDIAGISQFFQYTGEDIQGDYEFTVYAGTSAPQTTEAKRASELQLFQAVAPIIQQTGGDMRVAFSRLARYYDWARVDELFKAPKEKAKALAKVLAKWKQAPTESGEVMNAAAELVMATLTPGDMQVLQKELQGQAGAGQGQQPEPGGPPADATRAQAAQGRI